jgi:hypothetical protein
MVDISYEIVDFKGEVEWVELDNESYAVDLLYVDEFLNSFGC